MVIVIGIFIALFYAIAVIAPSMAESKTKATYLVFIAIAAILIFGAALSLEINSETDVNTSMLVPIGQLAGDEIHVSVEDGVATIASESYPFIWKGTPTEALVVLSYIGSTSVKDSTYYPLGLMDIMALSASGESIIVDEEE